MYRRGRHVVIMIKGWWNWWSLNAAAVQKRLLSTGAHYLLQVLIVGRLLLLAENGFEITVRMFCAEAMFEGYLKRPSSFELFLHVNLIIEMGLNRPIGME
jgi:hypothetical protein